MVGTERQPRLEDWHLELIATRGRRAGFRGADLDDAVQEAAIAVMAFEFDESRCNGATLETALTSVIDRSLWALRRKRSRYQRRMERVIEQHTVAWTPAGANEPSEPSYEVPFDLQCDVRDVLATLSTEDRQICRELAAGRSVLEVASRINRDWHTVRKHIERLREVFGRLGLQWWITTDNQETLK